MTRSDSLITDKVVKYEWPGMPELTLKEVRVMKTDSEDTSTITWKKIIVEAIDGSGQRWVGTDLPKMPGWTIEEEV